MFRLLVPIIFLFIKLNLTIGAVVTVNDPLITSWQKTVKAYAGFKNITGGIQQILYSDNYVYIYASGVPNYDIGPTWNNPNTPADLKMWIQFPRNTTAMLPGNPVNIQGISTRPPPPSGAGGMMMAPQMSISLITPNSVPGQTTVGLGHFGIWLSGVPMYNADDAQTYNNQGVWKRNAYFWEGSSFDSCNGHADNSGEYHQHVIPVCQFNIYDNKTHSPIIGYVFDGYPIYGPYGYSNPLDTSSAIKRITPSYVLRNYIQRTSLANGTVLDSAYYGPDTNTTTYPLGCFLDDYVYSAGSGDLDEYNGRFTKTPEYPNGIYAYYATIDANYKPLYPFIIGPKYKGYPILTNLLSKNFPLEAVNTYYSFNYTVSGSTKRESLNMFILTNAILCACYSVFF